MSRIEVKVGSPYEILIERGSLDRLGEELKRVADADKVLVVTDTNVAELYLEKAVKSLSVAGFKPYFYVIDAGERSKTPETYLELISALGNGKFKRTDAVVALGGGVVGDLAGFVSATYMRGISVVQVPTSLLAMIDSSIGGKTGVDLPYGKNLLGAFHQPKLVLADTSVLSTLPESEWKNGIGEGIKYACLAGGRIYEIMNEGLNDGNLDEFVALCAEYKADIVADDEKESGLRRLLNLGHTVGHAIEKQSNFEIPHGIAVAQGIAIMANASCKNGELSENKCRKITELLSKCGVRNDYEIGEEIISTVSMDKKAEGKDGISIVVIKDIGNCEVEKMTIGEFEKYIQAE